MPLPQIGQTITADQLDSMGQPERVGLVNPESSTGSGYIADVANQYWNAHPELTAAQVLTQLPHRDAQASNNQFALTVDPKTGRFAPDPSTVPTNLQQSGTLPVIGQTITTSQLDSLGSSAPFPKSSGATPIGPNTNSFAYQAGQFLREDLPGAANAAGTAIAQDAATGILDAQANIAYWKQMHATTPAQPLSKEQLASAHLMGVDKPGFLASGIDAVKQAVGMQGFPLVGMPNNQPGVTVGPTLKIPLDVLEKNVKNYISQRGESLDDLNRRAEETADPSSSTFDPLASLVQIHAGFLQSLLNPAYKHTVLLKNINLVAKAQQVIANPKGYSSQEVKEANGIVDYWKGHAQEGVWSTVSGLMDSFGKNPSGTVKSLVGGIVSTPELAVVGGVGDFGLGAKAAEAASRATSLGRTARVASSIEASEGASDIAKTMEAAANKTSLVYAGVAAKSAANARALARASRIAKMASGSAVGTGINTGLDYGQKEQQQGFANNLGGAAVSGALIGGAGAALHGNPLSRRNTLVDGTQDTRVPGQRIPGEPLPASTPIDSLHDVTYGGGVHSSLTGVHIDKDTPTSLPIKNRLGQSVVINPHDTIAYHERVEASLMHPNGPIGEDGLLKVMQRMGSYRTKENMSPSVMQKVKDGTPLSYQDAHEIAQASEHHMIDTEYNIDSSAYDKALKPFLKQAASKSESSTGIPPNTPPGIDTKPYDDMGHPEEVKKTGQSGGPTGATGGPRASHPEEEQAGLFAKNKKGIAALAAASSLGSLAASTLSQPGDDWKRKLELAAAGAVVGPLLLYTTDRFGRPVSREFGTTESGFIGRHAKEWSLENEAGATASERAGESPENIYAKYGMFRDPVGNWVAPSSDAEMQIDYNKIQNTMPSSGRVVFPLNDILSGSSLQRNYPELAKKIDVVVDRTHENGAGAYNEARHLLTVSGDTKNVAETVKTFAHELTHAMQGTEDMPRGSSPELFQQLLERDLGTELQSSDRLDSYLYHNYHNTYGEAMARYAEESANKSLAELQQNFPDFKLRVGDRIIVHGDLGGFDVKQEPPLSEHLRNSGDMEDDGKVPSVENIGNKLPNETEVVSKAKQGDLRAVTALYKHYYPIMLNTIRGMLNGKTRYKLETQLAVQPEDLAQDFFQVALKYLPDFRGDSSFYTYLHSIVRTRTLNAIRDANTKAPTSRLYRAGTLSNDFDTPLTGNVSIGRPDFGTNPMHALGEAEGLRSEELTPLQSMERTEQEQQSQRISDAVHEVLDKLDTPFRQVLIDHEFNGTPVADIAKKEGVSRDAVYKRLAKAQAMFKYSMQKGHGSKYFQGGFVTPKSLKNLVKFGIIPAIGATVGMHLASPEHELKGAVLGAIAGLFAARAKPVDTFQRIKFVMQHPNLPDIKVLTSGYQSIYHGVQREAFNTREQIKKLVPDASRREMLTHALEGKDVGPLSVNERQALMVAKNFYQRLGNAGIQAKVLKQILPNFVNHEWLSDRGDWTRHNLHRKLKSYADGMESGRVPKTLDLAELTQMYGRDMARAFATKHLQTGLRDFAVDLKGNTAIMPADKAPHNYKQIDHPALMGMAVHPSIVDPLSFIYEHPYGPGQQALSVLVSSTKRLKLGLSLFHPFTLGLVHLTTHPWMSHGGVAKAMKEIAQSTVGKTQMQNLYKTGGYGDMFDIAMKGGVGITHPGHGDVVDADVNNGLYQGLAGFEDWVSKYPVFGSAAGKSAHVLADVYHLTDKFVWENVHTGLKLQHFTYLFDTAKMNHLRMAAKDPSHVVPDDLSLARQMANYVNDAYGGLNWRQTVEDATTRYGRALAIALNSPSIRMAAQFSVLALDWTESTLRMFFRTFGKGSGFGGFVHPKMPTDFARLYMLRNAVLVASGYNAVNMVTTGHPIWENKDPNGNPEPFSIQLGNGETIQPNKHFFEAPNLLMDTARPLWQKNASPFQWELNKMGQYPKELLEQGLNMEYLAPEAPHIKNRLTHAGSMFIPISAGTFTDKGKLAAFLALFMQVSHHTKQATFDKRHRRRSRAAEAAAINIQ